ncbi:hypothetical protein ACLUWO_04965 [Pseudoscardovia radai]|uniref:hypothetical protein n=1 Tax=Pseudoscardovia radai TaxID=987066 RepID=UPI0039944B39
MALGKKKNTRQADTADPFAQPESDDAIEWQAIREARKAHHVRGMTVLILATLIMAMLGIGVSLRASSNVQTLTRQATQALNASADGKPGRDAAMEAVNEWLSGSGTPSPSGWSNLQWMGATKVQSASDNDGGTTDMWSHSFTYTDARTGRTRRVSQLVSVKDGVATPTGNPSVFPLSAEGTGAGGSSSAPDGYKTLNDTTTLTQVVKEWAKAYVGGSSDSLTVLVGDPDSSHAYQPAQLGDYKSASVNWAVWCDQNGAATDKDSGWAAASVNVSFTPYVSSTDAQSGSQTVAGTTSMTLTVLVQNPSSGGAKVVDWAADGAVSQLQAWSDGVDSGDVQTSAGGSSASSSASAGVSPSASSSVGASVGSASVGSAPATPSPSVSASK